MWKIDIPSLHIMCREGILFLLDLAKVPPIMPIKPIKPINQKIIV